MKTAAIANISKESMKKIDAYNLDVVGIDLTKQDQEELNIELKLMNSILEKITGPKRRGMQVRLTNSNTKELPKGVDKIAGDISSFGIMPVSQDALNYIKLHGHPHMDVVMTNMSKVLDQTEMNKSIAERSLPGDVSVLQIEHLPVDKLESQLKNVSFANQFIATSDPLSYTIYTPGGGRIIPFAPIPMSGMSWDEAWEAIKEIGGGIWDMVSGISTLNPWKIGKAAFDMACGLFNLYENWLDDTDEWNDYAGDMIDQFTDFLLDSILDYISTDPGKPWERIFDPMPGELFSAGDLLKLGIIDLKDLIDKRILSIQDIMDLSSNEKLKHQLGIDNYAVKLVPEFSK